MKSLKTQNRNQYFKLNVFSILTLLSCLITPYCFSQNQQTISVSEHIKVTANTFIGGYHIKCKGLGSGIVAANPTFGVGPYTYSWSNGATGESNGDLFAGIYTITITDANQEVHTDTFEIIEPDSLDYQVDLSRYSTFNIDRINGTTGIIAISPNGGTPPYKIYWNDNGGNEFKRKNLTAGTYSFLITDANECTKSGIINLNQPTDLTVTFTNIVGPSCYKKEDGKATINISGGTGEYYAIWDNGSSELNQTKLKGGHHAVRIFELDKLVLETGVTLPDPQELQLELVTSQYNGYNISCADCFNGSITSNVTGGTTPYAYQWSEASQSTTPSLINLTSGQYTLNVTDANGCETKSSVLLTMPSSKDWSRQGNANIDPNEFIGSTDASDVVFKSNNQEALRMAGNGNVGIKNSNPTEALDIIGNLKTSGMMLFSNQTSIAPLSGSNNTLEGITLNLEPIGIGQVVARPQCFTAQKKHVLTDGYFTSSSLTMQGKPTTYFGNDGANGIIESTSESATVTGTTALLLNYYCGNNVVVGKPSNGTLIANYRLGVGVPEPNERLEVAGNAIVNGRLSVGGAGNNGYFTTNTDYQLCVNGKIVATEVLVKLRNDWPDYVFKKDYKLKSIKEVSSFVNQFGHLPGIPSAKEMETKGINTGEMLNLQMQKIEELTLYIIDLQKQIDALKQAKN